MGCGKGQELTTGGACVLELQNTKGEIFQHITAEDAGFILMTNRQLTVQSELVYVKSNVMITMCTLSL